MKQPVTRFGRALRKERMRHGETLRDVAKATGISAPYLCQMETNDHIADVGYVDKLARYFGVDPLRWLRLARPDQYRIWRRAFGAECAVLLERVR